MAYHQLLARVADNFHLVPRSWGYDRYTGLHQIIGDREIDPSLPPVPFSQLLDTESGNDTWRRAPIRVKQWPPVPIDFRTYGGDLTSFLSEHTSRPTLGEIVFLLDEDDEPWVILNTDIDQGDPTAKKPWLGLHEVFHARSWFAPAHDARNMAQHMPEMMKDGDDYIDQHGHVDGCYFGEIGWAEQGCENDRRTLEDFETAEGTYKMVDASEDYMWEGSLYDCSISDSVSASLPSSFVRSRMSLWLDDHGPSWHRGGVTELTNLFIDSDHVFIARAAWLSEFLEANSLHLVTAALTLRRKLHDEPFHGSDDPQAYDRLREYSAIRIDHNLNVVSTEPVLVRD
jgi:hypothetical protein